MSGVVKSTDAVSAIALPPIVPLIVAVPAEVEEVSVALYVGINEGLYGGLVPYEGNSATEATFPLGYVDRTVVLTMQGPLGGVGSTEPPAGVGSTEPAGGAEAAALPAPEREQSEVPAPPAPERGKA